MKRFLIALQFLTILPVKIKSEIRPEDFGKSLAFFPLVGICIGLCLVAVNAIFSFLPHLVGIAIVLIASIILSGAIHLDGFADTCDGLSAGRTKDEILEIMRDSRIGTMGVIAVVLLLLFKFALLFSAPKEILWKILILMPIFARWVQVLACFSSGYVRKEGKAKYFVEFAGKRQLLIAGIFTLITFILLMAVKGIVLVFFSWLPIFLFIRYIKRRIGGMTGDTIGAASELSEIFMLLFALMLGYGK